MERRLYYCESWTHKRILINNQDVDICVSHKINGNQDGTTIQYHGIVHRDYKVYYIGTLNKRLSSQQAQKALGQFEEILRACINSKIQWMGNAIDSNVVKIWYYEEQETEKIVEDKRLWPPLRFAITVVNIKPIDDITDEIIQSELEQKVTDWVKSLLTIGS